MQNNGLVVSAVAAEGRPANCNLYGRGQLCAQRCPQHAGHLLQEHKGGRVRDGTGELYMKRLPGVRHTEPSFPSRNITCLHLLPPNRSLTFPLLSFPLPIS